MAVIALQRHVGRMAKNPAELKVAFSWLSLGPAVSNFVGPVLAGLLTLLNERINFLFRQRHCGRLLRPFLWIFL